MSILLRVTFDIPSKDYDCLTSETYFITCLIYLIEFSLRPIVARFLALVTMMVTKVVHGN